MITADLIPKRMRAMLMQTAPARVRTLLFRLRNSIQSWWPYRISFQDRGLVRKESPFNFAVSRNNILEELGKKYKPTKQLHNYLVYYWLHFRDIRLEVRRVLEIGLETDRSIRMWEEFFPNATVYGVDINPQCQQFEGDRRRVFIGDQSDLAFLDKVVNEAGGSLDIVIDDGSHRVERELENLSLSVREGRRHRRCRSVRTHSDSWRTRMGYHPGSVPDARGSRHRQTG